MLGLRDDSGASAGHMASYLSKNSSLRLHSRQKGEIFLSQLLASSVSLDAFPPASRPCSRLSTPYIPCQTDPCMS